MLIIDCPFCGPRDHSEFSYGEDASISYPDVDNLDLEAWYEAVFERENPRGPHLEKWHHQQGCRMWLVVERDTVTHEIFDVRAAHPDMAELSKKPAKKTATKKAAAKKTATKKASAKKTTAKKAGAKGAAS